MTQRLRDLYHLFVLTSLLSCATVNFDEPKPTTLSFQNTQETYLGQLTTDALLEKEPGISGFIPIQDGIEALSARLLMAERAERSIDAQYYLIKRGIVGYAFLDALLKAADRGVRVRLLLDDMFTSGYDAGLAGLNSHPNFEIRIFNPFANRSARFIDGITSFSRVNRRMHNKSFTVDNQITIVGGRNIADEYFGASEDSKFGDLDVLGIGPVVNDVSDVFDSYWNHQRAVPVSAFANMPADPGAELARVRKEIEESRQQIVNTDYMPAVRDVVLEYVESDTSDFIWAPYILTADSPDKSFRSETETSMSVTTELRKSLLSAETEIIVLSPYFVPLRSVIDEFIKLQARGVQIKIVTNSLAANNQIAVHSGYAPARKPLLRSGIEIYEARADADVPGADIITASGAKATLHTKVYIVDRKEIFIGSFNLDPRSIAINTEMGVIIKSPELAEQMATVYETALPTKAYQVFLNENGRLRWQGLESGQNVIYTKEPQTSWSLRLKARLFRLLPIRGQL